MGTTGQSITLANSIIGVGILAMPFCFQQCGVLLATLILILMGLVSRLCSYFLIKSAVLARRRNFEFLAFHVFGSMGKLAVEIGIIGFLMGTCIAYFVVVGDLGPQIVSKMFNINQSDMLRTSIMVIVSLVCVLPLGLLRNVDSLSNVSAATIGFYFCLVMKVITEAATLMLTVDWQSRVEMWKPSGVLQCVPIFSMALFCQTQLFEIFESLPSLSIEKMNAVTKNAINICTCVYFTLGLFGYIAFNSQEISGNILMSLSPTMANDVIKLGFVMSLAFSFPLIIFPCRASLYSLLYKKVHSSHHDHIVNHSIPESSFRKITVCIVALALGVSLLLPNIELVLGLVGSTIGVLVCLVFPAACFVNLTFKNTNERILAKGVIVLGMIIMILGTYANLQAAENQMDKYDEKFITKERIDKIVEDFFEKMEKTDGVMIKPETNHDKKVNGDIIKDSVVLPPNPVPPESQSNEKKEKHEIEIKKLPGLKDMISNDIVDKVSETHPKNLNKFNDAKFTNGKNKEEAEAPVKPKEEFKLQSNEEKINIMKQQQLIETIKQHGEEQKELLKEQKEILHEIKKTKQELQKNKNEAANDEAKKIAVESIKQIANIALQSLVGASDLPDMKNEEKKSLPALDQLADEAVQEIAQKAVETIEAIKEIKDKPNIKLDSLPNAPVIPAVQTLNNLNQEVNNAPLNQQYIQGIPNNQAELNNKAPLIQNSVNNNQINMDNQLDNVLAGNVLAPVVAIPPNVGQLVSNVGQAVVNNNQAVDNNNQNTGNVGQAAPDVQVAGNINHESANIVKPVDAEPSHNVPLPAAVVSPVANNQPLVEQILNSQNIVPQNVDLSNSNVQQSGTNIKAEGAKPHSHSIDEPQSYKLGEDAQKNSIETKMNAAIVQNVPVALAMNGNAQSNNNQQTNLNPNVVNNNAVIGNNAQNQDNVISNRQKREVVDCTEKSSLKPEDKEICETLIDPIEPPKFNMEIPDNINDVLPNVDLSKIVPNNLLLDLNALHHLVRSLKSFEENENYDGKKR